MADGQYITNAKALEAVHAVASVYDVDGVFNAAKLTEDITTVEGTVDSHVAGRYPVPVTGTAALAMVKGIVIALLRAEAYGRLGGGTETPAVILSNAKAARDQLKAISSGSLRLGAASESTDERTAGAFFEESEDPQMTRAKLKAF